MRRSTRDRGSAIGRHGAQQADVAVAGSSVRWPIRSRPTA